jgi:hypothetical protein
VLTFAEEGAGTPVNLTHYCNSHPRIRTKIIRSGQFLNLKYTITMAIIIQMELYTIQFHIKIKINLIQMAPQERVSGTPGYYIIIIIIIIITILVITFMQDIDNYIPETNHVSKVYSVPAVLYLQFVLHVMLFRP